MNQADNTYSQIILGTLVKDNTLLVFPQYVDLNPILSLLFRYFKEKEPQKKIGIILNKAESTSIFQEFIKIYSSQINFSQIKSSQSLESRRDKYTKGEILLITPQLLKNDILRQMITPEDFAFLFFSDAILVKGKHASAQLMEIFLKNAIFVRTAGLVQERFQSTEELEEVCEKLLITKIEYIEAKEQPSSLYKPLEEKVTVPINKPMYEFCFDINRYIKEYQVFLKEKGVNRPLAVRKEFPDFVMSLRKEYDSDQQQVLIRKAIELMNFVTIKELVEASGPKTALSFMERLKKRDEEEEDKFSSLTTKFARTPIFEEIYSEITKLSEVSHHPKLDRLAQLILSARNKTNLKRFYIIANHKSVLSELADKLKDIGLKSKNLPRSQSKERNKTLEMLKEREIDAIIASHFIKTSADVVIFYNVPTKYQTYLESKKHSKKVFLLVTHRSQEERVYHKFRNKEKSVGKIINHTKIKERLIQNQQIIFEKSIEKKMNSRTKAFVNLAKSLSKTREGRAEKTEYTETTKDEISAKQIQFLADCSYAEAIQISSLLSEKELNGIENLSIDEISEIFPRSRAIEIIENIEGRKYLASS
ncbi:MAG: hypothetical protein GOP50_04550 [Candidatus Heimdallarchaeota archaeon]|nr:hypothetical protein [Candidatus Heimdallarchaeota archaeon]